MKYILRLLIISAMLLSTVKTSACQIHDYYMTTADTIVYDAPSTGAAVIQHVPRNTGVSVWEVELDDAHIRENHFVKVCLDDNNGVRDGWIQEDHVARISLVIKTDTMTVPASWSKGKKVSLTKGLNVLPHAVVKLGAVRNEMSGDPRITSMSDDELIFVCSIACFTGCEHTPEHRLNKFGGYILGRDCDIITTSVDTVDQFCVSEEVGGLNLRTDPDLSSKNVVAVLQPGTVCYRVIPHQQIVKRNGDIWWKVVTQKQKIGWINATKGCPESL